MLCPLRARVPLAQRWLHRAVIDMLVKVLRMSWEEVEVESSDADDKSKAHRRHSQPKPKGPVRRPRLASSIVDEVPRHFVCFVCSLAAPARRSARSAAAC